MREDLLHGLGIPADLPAPEKAAAVVRRCVLRLAGGGSARDHSTVLESRWFAGTAECVRVLANLFRGTVQRGTAFGCAWPYLEAGGRVVAPALPVVVSEGEATGPDGVYRLRPGAVWREAVGEDRPCLWIGEAAADPDPRIDLVWFGAGERYLLRQGTLEVEDLFSLLRMPADRRMLERLLTRPRRVDPDVLAGVALPGGGGASEIEVRRTAALVGGDRWRDPAIVLGARADIRRVTRQEDRLLAETALGEQVVFAANDEPDGWRLYAWEGKYPLRTLTMKEQDGILHFGGGLKPGLDPLTPGLRQRLAFDLLSDLVSLGS